RLEIDDDVRDRNVVARTNRIDDTPFEPVRLARRMRRDDDLVRMEGVHRVVHRDEWVAVSHLPGRFDPHGLESLEGLGEALLRGLPRRIRVRGERLDPRVERGADDEELRLLTQRTRTDGAQELLALDGLVRNDEHALLAFGAHALDALALGRGPALAEVDRDGGRGQPEERQEPERGRDPGRHDAEGERSDRDQQEAESRFLATERALHSPTQRARAAGAKRTRGKIPEDVRFAAAAVASSPTVIALEEVDRRVYDDPHQVD